MKFLAVIALFSIVACAFAAVIIPEVVNDGGIEGADGKMLLLEDVDTDGGLSTSTELSPIRHRRITCDLLSFKTKVGSISSIACPARCLAQGRPGGSCKNGVCVCR